MPRATVAATNAAIALTRSVTTNGEGAYTFANLPVGTYELTVNTAGFATLKITSVTLNVGQNLTVNGLLVVAGIATGPGDLFGYQNPIDTENSKIDSVIASSEIENLPLNGRNFLELALLTPGNTPAPNFDPTKTNTVVISSAGQIGRGSNVMIDGTDNNDDVVGGSLINISQDAVQEFQVATNRFSAEYGRSASSVINVVTKSGTNMLHGSVSFFERDRRLQGLPATYDRRQSGAAVRPAAIFVYAGRSDYKGQAFCVLARSNIAIRTAPSWSASAMYRTGPITNGFAAAPLNDSLVEYSFGLRCINDNNQLNFRYSFRRRCDRFKQT